MRIAHEYNEEAAVAFNIISLIDIVFFLLIFFLAATTFAQVEREAGLQLPGSDAPTPLSVAPDNIIINIGADGVINVAGKTYDRDGLKALLATLPSDRNVLIRADERVVMKYFADVADLCYAAGIAELKIGYIPRSVPIGGQ